MSKILNDLKVDDIVFIVTVDLSRPGEIRGGKFKVLTITDDNIKVKNIKSGSEAYIGKKLSNDAFEKKDIELNVWIDTSNPLGKEIYTGFFTDEKVMLEGYKKILDSKNIKLKSKDKE